MSYDGIFTHIIVQELNDKVTQGRINKIYQPYQHELVLTIRANRKNQKLLLSAHPSYARIQLTEEPLSNPDQAPNFCMFLRKNIEGSTIEAIEQLGNDRIVTFKIKKFDDLGDLKHYLLIVEMMGRHSNIFLVDSESGIIMDCLKHVPAYQNSYRTIMPGASYVLPPHQEKLNPFTATPSEIATLLDNLEEGSDAKNIQRSFQGIGRDTATEIAAFMTDGIPGGLSLYLNKVQAGPPTLFIDTSGKETFAPYPYQTMSGETKHYESPSLLLDGYYVDKAHKDRIKQVASDLLGIIKNELHKNELKLEKLADTLNKSEEADEFRIKGELLTAYLYEVPKSAKTVTLNNFYANEEPLTIPLDPALSAPQNAQKYFSRYHKLVNSVKFVNEQIEKTKGEIEYLESIETQIKLSDPQDLEDIREELKEAGYLKAKKKNNKKQKKKTSKPHLFQSSDGTTIRVGKNNKQNDELTMKNARNNHYWLHAKDIPGSHVIVESSEPTQQTLEEAAIIAAYYSKFQQSANVPVDYVPVKFVKKPNGAKPGFVIYTDQQTLFVTPDKEIVDSLRIK